jgi:fructose transport system ATP-binding protein
VLRHTAWGRHVYATGDDPEAAELAGVPTKKVLIQVYALAGFFCAIAGWVMIGRFGSVSPTASTGQLGNIQSITAVVIGGISLFGGRGSIIVGMFFGALIVGDLRDGPALVGTDPQWTFFLIGALIIFAVAIDQWIRKVSHDPTHPEARGLVKRYGKVTALDHCDFDLMPGEILAVIGDNGAGKSSLIKALSGAVIPDEGEIRLEGRPVAFRSPIEARARDRDASTRRWRCRPRCPSPTTCSWAARCARGHGPVVPHAGPPGDGAFAREKLNELGLMTIQNINQAVETLSGGQRQGVAVARAAAFGSKVVILDEPTAALGVKESRRVLELIRDVRSRGIPIILISHNMPHVFEVADRIHIHRLGRRLCVIKPQDYIRCRTRWPS